MSVRIVRGHDVSPLPGTEYVHCRLCGGSGYLGNRPSSLASECPKTQASTLYLNNIYKKMIDFKQGKWVSLNVGRQRKSE